MSFAAVGLLASVGSSVIGAAGAMQQGAAAKQEAEYQAAVARNNAVIARENARYTREAGQQEEGIYRIKQGQTLGTQRAALAASGVDVNSGSALDTQLSSYMIGELDALTVRNKAIMKQRDYLNQAVDYEAQAGLYNMKGKNAQKAGQLGALGSIIGGIGSVAGKWSSMKLGSSYG